MAMVKDPVCNMEFDSGRATAQTTYQGQEYYFCSEECRRAFEENPDQYTGSGADEPDHKPPGA